jgi:hypothetical protein
MAALTRKKNTAKNSIVLIKKYTFLRITSLYKNVIARKPRKHKAKNLFRLISTFIVISLLVLFFSPLFSGAIVKSFPVAYTTTKVQDSSIELGDTQTEQLGADGIKTITYAEPKSLYNILFGGGMKNSLKIKTSTITKQAVQEVINSGTLKYQYMYCSDGMYRYYTDAQFESPDIGFTHKSTDYCAQNNEGTETQLANMPPKSTESTSNIPISDFTVPNCTTTSIPYGVDYESVSWLPTGQTETFAGLNGTYFSCIGTSVQPVDEVVYTGTGQDYNAEAEEEATAQARQKCTDEYNSAIAQIDAAGAAGSSATIEVQQLYSECLDAAG